jgi:hypothetical protein
MVTLPGFLILKDIYAEAYLKKKIENALKMKNKHDPALPQTLNLYPIK